MIDNLSPQNDIYHLSVNLHQHSFKLPSKRTTSFRHPYNIHNVKATSCRRQNNVVCVLGYIGVIHLYKHDNLILSRFKDDFSFFG